MTPVDSPKRTLVYACNNNCSGKLESKLVQGLFLEAYLSASVVFPFFDNSYDIIFHATIPLEDPLAKFLIGWKPNTILEHIHVLKC